MAAGAGVAGMPGIPGMSGIDDPAGAGAAGRPPLPPPPTTARPGLPTVSVYFAVAAPAGDSTRTSIPKVPPVGRSSVLWYTPFPSATAAVLPRISDIAPIAGMSYVTVTVA